MQDVCSIFLSTNEKKCRLFALLCEPGGVPSDINLARCPQWHPLPPQVCVCMCVCQCDPHSHDPGYPSPGADFHSPFIINVYNLAWWLTEAHVVMLYWNFWGVLRLFRRFCTLVVESLLCCSKRCRVSSLVTEAQVVMLYWNFIQYSGYVEALFVVTLWCCTNSFERSLTTQQR